MKTILGLALAASISAFAHADIKPVKLKSRAGKVAMQAADVFEVTNLQIADMHYKVVVMDSRLNGDLSATTFIVVGEGAVGGAAGFENAFLITPEQDYISIRGAAVVDEAIQVELYKLDGTTEKKSFVYDAAKKVLVQK